MSPTVHDAQRMRTAVGTRATEDLPHTHRCGNRWSGSNTSHCAACCRTFSGVSTFDAHRPHGVCVDPASVGMSPIPGRAYECWGFPSDIGGGE